MLPRRRWGVNYSVKQTDFLGLDSRQTYLALLDDLKVKKIKISVHWDLLEKKTIILIFLKLIGRCKKLKKEE
jgi:hypothetical protein